MSSYIPIFVILMSSYIHIFVVLMSSYIPIFAYSFQNDIVSPTLHVAYGFLCRKLYWCGCNKNKLLWYKIVPNWQLIIGSRVILWSMFYLLGGLYCAAIWFVAQAISLTTSMTSWNTQLVTLAWELSRRRVNLVNWIYMAPPIDVHQLIWGIRQTCAIAQWERGSTTYRLVN